MHCAHWLTSQGSRPELIIALSMPALFFSFSSFLVFFWWVGGGDTQLRAGLTLVSVLRVDSGTIWDARSRTQVRCALSATLSLWLSTCLLVYVSICLADSQFPKHRKYTNTNIA